MVNLHTSPATGFQVSYAQGRQQTSLIISTFEKNTIEIKMWEVALIYFKTHCKSNAHCGPDLVTAK